MRLKSSQKVAEDKNKSKTERPSSSYPKESEDTIEMLFNVSSIQAI